MKRLSLSALTIGLSSLFITSASAQDIALTHPDHVKGSILSGGSVLVDFNSLITTPGDAHTKMNWDDAVSYCDDLVAHGHDDWYLPDQHQLQKLLQNRGKGFLKGSFDHGAGFHGAEYWSSSIDERWPERPVTRYSKRWDQLFVSDKEDELNVRCVRHDVDVHPVLRR